MSDNGDALYEPDRYNIMVVDDLPENLHLLTDILQEKGFKIRAATSGRIALTAIKHQLPDLLLLDIRMPGMDGFEVCGKLKSDPATREIPIIFISAQHELRHKIKAFSLGGVDYLTKPFETEEVIARVKTHLTIGSLRQKLKEANEVLEEKVRVRTLAADNARRYIAGIVDAMPSMMVGIDPDARVTRWNRRAEEDTGILAPDAVGRPLTEVLALDPACMAKVHSVLSNREVAVDPKRPHTRDGVLRYEEMTVYPLDEEGGGGAVIRLDDVTERVNLEEAVIQNEKMLSVGGLAAGMAHEINNPIAGVMQTADVMANRLGNNLHLPANQKAAEAAGTTTRAVGKFMEKRGILEMIATIKESSMRMAGIVENMLSFARKSDNRSSSHDLSRLLDRTVELAATDYNLEKNHDFRKIAIKREYEPGLPVVPCEGAKIQQVLLNILANGSQAMQGAGVPEPAFIFRSRFEKNLETVRLEIEDNGPGMDEGTRQRVFEPFFTTKPPGMGTGLGLSVSCFIITENHGGELKVESTPGSGAKFIIRLPVKGKKP